MGKNMHFLPECHSTNSVTLEMSRQGILPEGTLVITENQTAGRGQRGNSWVTEAGKNLTFTLVLHPKFLPLQNQFLLSQAVSLGICDLLGGMLSTSAAIKWPNDIMVKNRKIGGILIENQLTGSTIELSAIGIGLNVNQTEFSVPTASSISVVEGKKFDLNEVLNDLCQSLEVRYLQLKNHQWNEVREDYTKALYWREETHTFFSKGRTFVGVIKGVDDTGRLQVLTDGEWKAFDLKEILYLH